MRDLVQPRRADLRLTAILHALSDPTRLGIVCALIDGEKRTCGEFESGLTKSSLSHHFRVLRESGITHTRRNGRNLFISMRRDDLDARFPGLLDSILEGAKDEVPSYFGPKAMA